MSFSEKAKKDINTYILNKANKGFMLSNSDVSMYLDSYVSKAERKAGKILLSSEDFDALDSQIGQELIEEKKVYINGNWESFNTLVRSRGLCAYSEVQMRKSIRDYKTKTHTVVVRDLEFPIDDDGNYLPPTDNILPNNYSYKFTPIKKEEK